MRIAIVGGGAAGIFAAITAKQLSPEASVIVLEKSAVLLSKVRVSGGGRCNVTHACFDPKQLVNNYPRGYRELLGPFHRFQPRDTIEWFESRSVALKIENDGRMFPVTDSSQTIIDCLLSEARELGVEIRLRSHLARISPLDSAFQLHLAHDETLQCDRLMLATGSHAQGFQFAQSLGHTIATPVPSLFTFNIPTSPLHDLSGITLDEVELTLAEGEFTQRGPLLITHWGFSGPAALKLSAWAA
jgi:predicted Rossmann fold flavoprotein